jgi:hypothetical protein
VFLKTFFPLLISTQPVAFSSTGFCTTLYFVNQRNYKKTAMQAHALTRALYFYSLNVIISHQIVYKEGLGYLSVCAIVSRSSPPSQLCICSGSSKIWVTLRPLHIHELILRYYMET